MASDRDVGVLVEVEVGNPHRTIVELRIARQTVRPGREAAVTLLKEDRRHFRASEPRRRGDDIEPAVAVHVGQVVRHLHRPCVAARRHFRELQTVREGGMRSGRSAMMYLSSKYSARALRYRRPVGLLHGLVERRLGVVDGELANHEELALLADQFELLSAEDLQHPHAPVSQVRRVLLADLHRGVVQLGPLLVGLRGVSRGCSVDPCAPRPRRREVGTALRLRRGSGEKKPSTVPSAVNLNMSKDLFMDALSSGFLQPEFTHVPRRHRLLEKTAPTIRHAAAATDVVTTGR